jgi:hypothetical protein
MNMRLDLPPALSSSIAQNYGQHSSATYHFDEHELHLLVHWPYVSYNMKAYIQYYRNY